MKRFEPDYRHLVDAAQNREAGRLPLYEHGMDPTLVERVLGRPVAPLLAGTPEERVEGIRRICQVSIRLGYDCVPFARNITQVVQQGLGLMGQAPALIKTMADLDTYPWEAKVSEFIHLFEADYEALRKALPAEMKAVGGINNGLFEIMQDFVPYSDLAYMQVDNPDLYVALWECITRLMRSLWRWLLDHYADCFAVCRFGDDLGFRSSTLLHPDDIRTHILPGYRQVVDMIHAQGKPFLLHSCGRIYDVMDDLIELVGIDAKHSNEDAIDPFDVWVERYGDRIGNFGGVDMHVMATRTPDEVKAYVHALLPKIDGHGGLAIGTVNQISSYVKPENWIAMTEAVREWRGDYVI